MSGKLSSHHRSFNSSYFLVHNHARVDVFTMTSFPSLFLNGIAGGTKQPWNYLNDPVLMSYWWCLSNAFRLWVERRIPSISSPGCSSPSHHNFLAASPIQHITWSNGSSTLNGAGDLGIFWYGDKSQGLISLVVPYILKMEGENGSWEDGLSYECRSLLIKALHNLIERSVWKFSPLLCYKMVLTNNF